MNRRIISAFLSLLTLSISAQSWGTIDYDGTPWVCNISAPNKVTRGLQNRHLSLWASHGRYYSQRDSAWQWQRPNLFTTREDLFTQTIVVPYLIPMLENAGAIVFTPRERDWQRHEVIIDNDDHRHLVNYIETGFRNLWQQAPRPGFAMHDGAYVDGENPFVAGTARMAEATRSHSKYSQISYQPNIPEEGYYAVYVSYQTVEGSINDAHYTVWHQGQQTEFRVNQQMGGSTWVYLGTFHFDKGCNNFNRVVLTNQSNHHGIVTADAVRFGGGMGNIERGGSVSGLPRAFEGARYYGQWAGMPYDVYSSKYGQDDYGDDINVRSYMENYLAGGSCYVPNRKGLSVPIELSLAIHSDAGFDKKGESLVGTLTVCTTDNNGDSLFNNQLPRTMSKELAGELLYNTANDMQRIYGVQWPARELRDRNYSETRNPEMPSAILETLSHQNFNDMCYGLNPNFRFQLARSIYKTILRYTSRCHNEDYVVTPLTPTDFRIELSKRRKGEATLSWTPVNDSLEASAEATDYIVYTACGSADFDNGQLIHGTSYTLRLEPGRLYSFRVAAVNRGGCSFPSAVVCARYSPTATKSILIIDGFQRLASPAVRNTLIEQGFDADRDMGVSYGLTAGWAGHQLIFDRNKAGIEDSTGLGYGTDHLAGTFIAGNTFDYVKTHAQAICNTQQDCNIISCSRAAIEHEALCMDGNSMVDIIMGLQRNDYNSIDHYTAFTSSLTRQLQQYVQTGGSILISGAYIGSEINSSPLQPILSQLTKCRFTGTDSYSSTLKGLGLSFDIYREPNEKHYCVPHTDILEPEPGAVSVMAYADGYSAAVAYQGSDYRTIIMGFPFECIQSSTLRTTIMHGILNYLINNKIN